MTHGEEILADWHLLGSSGGYRTLAASPCVTPAERTQLERFDPFRDLVGDGPAALQNSVCAFLHRLDSRRLAIRRVMPDPVPDNYGRRSILAASLVLSESDYGLIAGVDAGRNGSGLEGIVRSNEPWERIVANQGGSGAAIPLATPRRRGHWTIHDIDFLIFDAWLSACASSRQVRIERGSEFEARLLAIPSLLPRSRVADFAWGIGIMRAVHPGTVASFLVPEFEPSDALDVLGTMEQPLAGKARGLMRRFPESEWHSDQDYRLLERMQVEAAEQARQRQQEVHSLRSQLEKAQAGHDTAERNAGQIREELLGKDARIRHLEKQRTLTWTIGGGIALIGLIVLGLKLFAPDMGWFTNAAR